MKNVFVMLMVPMSLFGCVHTFKLADTCRAQSVCVEHNVKYEWK